MSDEARFGALAAHVFARAGRAGARAAVSGGGERSAFVRLNHGRVRQAGSVTDGALTVAWRVGARHASATVTLSGDDGEDRARLDALCDDLAAVVSSLAPDPHLRRPPGGESSRVVRGGTLPEGPALAAELVDAADGADVVGILAAGPAWRGFADDDGTRHWHEAVSWSLDVSTVAGGDRAVKTTLGGDAWDGARVAGALAEARERAALLTRAPVVKPPGTYAAWLAPAAVVELLDLLSWGDLGGRSQVTGASALARLVRGDAALHPDVHLDEDVAGGLAPAFSAEGFLRQETTPLIASGRHAGALISPRTAAEHGLDTTGADPGEAPVSLSMRAGDLPDSDVLSVLGTGVWVSNLWYLNHSDRAAGRVTGMTRFATLWVEGGEIVGPLAVMRFDGSVYDILGRDLAAIGAVAPRQPSVSTYGSRQLGSVRAPGVLTRLAFTL